MKLTSEAQVRELRERIYGPITDASWECVKANWLKPENVRWLQQENEKEARRAYDY